MKITEIKLIELAEFDSLVKETYKKPYSLQQQEGGMERHLLRIAVPVEEPEDHQDGDMGVSFETWLNTSLETFPFEYEYQMEFFWEREFYPPLEMIVNDLFNQGLMEAGEYGIDINW